MAGRALRVTLAGACRVGPVGGGADQPVETRQGRLVLARLALAEGPVTRDELVDLLWPMALPRAWARNVSVVVSRLRRLLTETAGDPQATIATSPGVFRLVLPAGSVVDVVEAEAMAARAADALLGERLDEALVSARASAAVARLPLLPGESAVWLDQRREWLRRVLVQALHIEVQVAVRLRDPAGVAAAGTAIELEPTAARGYADAMRLHLALGEPAAALAVHTRYRRAVIEEAGVPEDATVARLRASALGGSPCAPVGPPSQPGTASTVPSSSTSFVGRRRELVDLGTAVLGSPLVTLTGPAGIGKTRLARELARSLARDYPDGVRECRLAEVAHPTGVVPAVAAAVGAMPQAGRSLADSVVDALAPMRLLLLLDNCEHLLPAVTVLAERIITGCPGVRVLATSRERIDAEGEVVHPLEPLVVPAADADPARAWAEPPEALQLLRDRLLSVRPGFVGGSAERAALVEVCRQLDGLPLAIELAAARMSGMSVLDVAERLERRLTVLTRGRRTAPTRHRTLRAAIGWSYDLLDEPQRRVFERASVFSGGFTLVAAGQVCGGHRLGAEETADVVGSLVDKSLLVLDGSRGAGRYDMLETLREFAHERLEVRGEAELIARAHAEFFTALAERADVLVRGPDERAGVALFRDEMTNLRAAHAWARRAGRADLACALSAAVGWYAFFRMQTDLLAWAEHVPDAAGPRYAEALATAGRGAWMRGDLADAQFLADRSLAAARDDPSARCGWHLQANVALFRGDLPRAADCYDRATRLAEQSADGYHLALLLGCRALVSCYVGDAAAAATVAAAAATAAARCGTPSALAWTEYVQGEVLAAADPARAMTHLQRADAVAATVDAEFVRGVAGLTAASLHARHGEPTAAALAVAQLIDRWLRGGNHRQLWTTLREAAELLVRVDRPLAAATVLGAIEHADADNLWGADADRLDRLHQRLRDQLGTDLARPWSRGADLDLPALADLVRGQLHEASRTGGASDGSATANLLQPRVPTLPARADRPAQHR